ncbi:hypothetical protein B296_00057685 [Ensete ventricosum]|uniref:Uncharacterized protein n=1 Tax=Ensete ventricosum TaxID=4639 RepID=A0A426XQ77_ENSVE|nr:hypothetical protein B296_00057685 [Ensete ventricosum]
MLASVTHDLTDTLRKMHVAIASTTPDINWHPSRDPRPRRLTPLATYTLGDSRRAPRLVVYHRMPSASLPPSRIRHLTGSLARANLDIPSFDQSPITGLSASLVQSASPQPWPRRYLLSYVSF